MRFNLCLRETTYTESGSAGHTVVCLMNICFTRYLGTASWMHVTKEDEKPTLFESENSSIQNVKCIVTAQGIPGRGNTQLVARPANRWVAQANANKYWSLDVDLEDKSNILYSLWWLLKVSTQPRMIIAHFQR